MYIQQKCKKKKCKGKNNFFNPNYTSTQPNAPKRKLSRRQKKKGGIFQTVPFYQANPIKQAEEEKIEAKDTTNKKISESSRKVTYNEKGEKVVTKIKASVKGNPYEGNSVSKSKKVVKVDGKVVSKDKKSTKKKDKKEDTVRVKKGKTVNKNDKSKNTSWKEKRTKNKETGESIYVDWEDGKKLKT